MLRHPITVEGEAKDGLSRHRWVFVIEGRCIVLHRYFYEQRGAPTERFKVIRFYEQGSEQSYGDWQWLTIEEVPWDEGIKGEALAELLRRFVVVREGEERPGS